MTQQHIDTHPIETAADAAPVAEMPEHAAAAADPATHGLKGRSIFAVETVAGGVLVRPAFLTSENGVMIAGSAVFPNLSYALQQIDALRQVVEHHFNQAATLGSRLVAQQTAAPGQHR
jgi:hypothetical protein